MAAAASSGKPAGRSKPGAAAAAPEVPLQAPVQFTLGKPEVPLPEHYLPFCLPLGPPSAKGNCFSELDGSGFQLRGKSYMEDGVKTDASAGVMRLRHVEFFRHTTPLDNVAERKGSFLQLARAAGDDRKYLVIVYQTPGKTKIHLVLYFAFTEEAMTKTAPPHLQTIWERFTDAGAEDFRKQRWKVIPRIAEGAWLVSSTVGTKPALLGTKLDHTWHFGDGFIEVDCNVMSSSVATMIVGVIEGAAKSVVIDLAFTIEGREEEELPEAILGAVRLSRMHLGRMGHLKEGMYGAWMDGVDPFDETQGPRRKGDGSGEAAVKEGWLW
ncbi:hypothetical protein FNF31_03216 [Cafeteria roenbergensis]|uniref:Protein ENHANCED DISEASE RESISTANCE 2 C-terminal domain-containing protein n=1 Tax=Cafeteria roenbergensis TaxID=33653 RepID=A0A5A8DY37_CAFRO|nr:hypothetical protein FNF31_03216 [Cafeteria roenbergensis]KAA0170435.1 hypothetical protein FNF28_01429 [Cafeteria roenbergensis]